MEHATDAVVEAEGKSMREAFAAAATALLRPQEPKWHRCTTPKQLKFVEGERQRGTGAG